MDGDQKGSNCSSCSNKCNCNGIQQFFRISPETFGARLTDHYSNILGKNLGEFNAVNVFSDADIDKILKDIFNGSEDIPKDLFDATYKYLAEGVDVGYGDVNSPTDATMVYQLKNNVAVFSAFKANHYGSTMRQLLVNDEGKKRTWGEFRKEAIQIDPKYNQLWLAAEYNLATRQARTAQQWEGFKRDQDVYPNLEYMPSRSANQRDAHVRLYGTILPLDDPFWDTAMPPNGWGCKCWVKQTRAEITNADIEAPLPIPGIEGNAGKTGRVFSASHAFVTAVEKKDKAAVQETFNKYKSDLNDVIVMKVGKNSVNIPVNADPIDLLANVSFAKAVVQKYKKDFAIRSHSFVSGVKNPEFNYQFIGDRTQWDKAKDARKYVQNSISEKLGDKGQLRDQKKCFIGLD
ncbi:MAG: phage minor head protein, partial [Bacteroidales bacterium]